MLKLSKNEPEKKEYFFALEIDIDRVKSAIWTVEESKAKLVALGETSHWEDEEELLDSVDASLSSTVEKFTPKGEIPEPNKVIFGLSPDWVEESNILPEKLEILKKISRKFGLSPLGFVVIPEAIVHWLKKLEGVPPTAILIGLCKKKITVSLVNLGKIVKTSGVMRSENIGADLIEGLSRFERETSFPARILLYDSEENLEEVRQELIRWPWQEGKINFLHLPKVEILSANFDIKAIVLASALQMGGIGEVETEVITKAGEKETKETEETEETEEIEETEETKETEAVLGFIKGQDISRLKPELTPTASVVPEKEEAVSLKRPLFDLSWIKRINFLAFFASAKNLFSTRGFSISILVGIILTLLLAGLGIIYWYLPKASVILYAEPQVLEKDFTVKLDPSLTTADKANLFLPAQKVEKTVEGEREIQTTGTKLVGERSKGEVTIYNRTSKEKVFPKETQIIGPGNLRFTLDEEVAVASESVGSDYVRIPGKAKVKVTAVDIGSEGNLASGTEFVIGNYARSDFIARNDSNFSGGTSREIQVVAKNDQERLLVELQKELEQKAIRELKNKLALGRNLVEESLVSQVLEKSFDKTIDEEANKVKLKLRLKVEVLSFSEDEFKKLVEEEIRKSVPPDFEYDPDQTEVSFKLKEPSDQKTIFFIAHFKANLVPKLDTEEIKNNLVGKKPMIGMTYLGNLSHIESFEAKIVPKLPTRIATFPRIAKRISIEVKLK